ncbi:MAG: hypothetical protein LBU76_02455, partial [Azoarcus sp.]|nr:hypothetical protein [Azoarcus sp.]
MNDTENTQVTRVRELGGREATVLENSGLRVMIDDLGGMTPEMSARRGTEGEIPNAGGAPMLNAHWLPWFRSSS